MCGISGIYNFNGEDVNHSILTSMNNTLIHRGPDVGNVLVSKHLGLGHRRLSIIDLTEKANQPMSTVDGHYTIVFNGEIYNFPELKEELIRLGYRFQTKSDTEVILKTFEEFKTDCFRLFNGMFAIAIYDHIEETLILARDQFGIKPLYYFRDELTFLFASEIKAIKTHPTVNLTIKPQALSEYIWFGNPLGNNTIYKEIIELKPGTFLEINSDTFKESIFFNINSTIERNMSEDLIITKIRTLLEEGVKRHLISDVPVGIFLSGGVDSSAITAFASKYYKGKIKTYSAAFDYDNGINEWPYARRIAKEYGTDHHEIKIKGKDLVDVIENLVDAHDEPFGDAANIPLYLLTKKLKGKIKVILQGDGGDEFFGGYSRYNTMYHRKRWSKLSFLKNIIQLSGTKITKIKRIERFLNAISQKEHDKRNALLLTMESNYSNPFRVFNDKWQKKMKDTDPFEEYKKVHAEYSKNINETQAIFYTDAQIILKDTFFEKVDKASMSNSIEVRVPFLDKNLTDFMLSVPGNMKTKKGKLKYLLKKALKGVIPSEVLKRKKTGFGVPYSYWLKTTLKEYFSEQISTKEVAKYLDQKEIIKMFDLHKRNKGNYDFLLWKVLIFSVWVNHNAILNDRVK